MVDANGKVEHIGNENYTYKISKEAKYVKKINSEIMKSLNKIIKIVSIIIIPIGALLFFNQLGLEENTIKNAVVNTVAALIGMIPEGLILLTSTVLAVSVIRLSKNKVLVQELYCIETLARVDTLCLDKTGTITEGKMEVANYIYENSKEEMEQILYLLATYSQDNNGTMDAIKETFNKKVKGEVIKEIPFSSDKKWSGISFKNGESYILGAPEYVLKEQFKNYKEKIEEQIQDYRVVVLARSHTVLNKKVLPKDIEYLGMILLTDSIRPQAKQTLQYFKQQGVTVKLISGDNPITVAKIAKHAGLKEYKNYIDCSKLQTDEELKKVANQYTIFGRVTPIQKKQLIVALKEQGHTVAMTGDGVNDVIALKEADCSIAIASGSDAARNVSQLVLLDSDFKSMPKILTEGRRTINNIERSATLFLVKTIYSGLLAILFLFLGEAFPFVPIQMSLIGTVTIGLPSFLLALEPNKERIQGKFLKNVVRRAMPVGLTVILNILILTVFNKRGIITEEQYSSMCVIGTGICGIILLFTFAKTRKSENSKLPVSIFRLSLALLVTGLFILGLTAFNWWFNIAPLIPLMPFIPLLIIISLCQLIFSYFMNSIKKDEKKKVLQ